MGFLAFLILGLIAGAIAKAILPGRQGGGIIITLILGVVGALLGGFIGSALFGVGINEFFSLSTWLLHQPAVTAPVVGPRTQDQLDSALRALDLALEPDALQRLDDIFPGYRTAPEEYAW